MDDQWHTKWTTTSQSAHLDFCCAWPAHLWRKVAASSQSNVDQQRHTHTAQMAKLHPAAPSSGETHCQLISFAPRTHSCIDQTQNYTYPSIKWQHKCNLNFVMLTTHNITTPKCNGPDPKCSKVAFGGTSLVCSATRSFFVFVLTVVVNLCGQFIAV